MNWLLKKLKLHLLKLEEQIIQQEVNLFTLEVAKQRVQALPDGEFDASVVMAVTEQLEKDEAVLKNSLLQIAHPGELDKSLRIQAINIEREAIRKLFLEGHVTENVVFEFEAELDLQQDAIEYPEVSAGRGYEAGGRLPSNQIFRKRVAMLRKQIERFPLLSFLFRASRKQLIFERFALLQTRIIVSSAVIQYLDKMKVLLAASSVSQKVIDEIQSEHERFRLKNSLLLQALQRDYQRVHQKFQTSLIESYAWGSSSLADVKLD